LLPTVTGSAGTNVSALLELRGYEAPGSVLCLVHTPGLDPAPGVPAASRTHLRTVLPLSARPARFLLTYLSVHKPVDDLCKKAASLCARGEMLGIAVAARTHIRAVT
jgi:hypothetical protein